MKDKFFASAFYIFSIKWSRFSGPSELKLYVDDRKIL